MIAKDYDIIFFIRWIAIILFWLFIGLLLLIVMIIGPFYRLFGPKDTTLTDSEDF
jgi:hypothetical protein